MLFELSKKITAETNLLMIRVALPGKNFIPSLDPLDSDSFSNLLFGENLIGTLVKYSGSGCYEPYVAESWEPDPTGCIWTFKLRPNLRDDAQQLIDPIAYKTSLERNFRLYVAKQNSIPVFSDLAGWDQAIKNGTSIPGIVASGDKLEFRFTHKQNATGLLPYLSMPYYGFYSANDYLPDGKWKDRHKLTASGAYRIFSFNSDQTITLQKRDDWPLTPNKSPNKIIIEYFDSADFASVSQRADVVLCRPGMGEIDLDKFQIFHSTPTYLTAAVVSPILKSPLQNDATRKMFFSRLRSHLNGIDPKLYPLGTSPANSFYADGPAFDVAHYTFNELPQPQRDHQTSIDVALNPETIEARQVFIKTVLTEVLRSITLEPNFIYADTTKPDYETRRSHHQIAPINLQSVDIGESIESWVIRMMFCSKLGISFPDVHGKVCNLCDAADNETITTTEYHENFIKALTEDAYVVPTYRWGRMWLFNRKIRLVNTTQATDLPRFDLMIQEYNGCGLRAKP